MRQQPSGSGRQERTNATDSRNRAGLLKQIDEDYAEGLETVEDNDADELSRLIGSAARDAISD